MRRVLIVAAAVLAVGACGESQGDYQTAVDTLTRRQKDSLISEMPIPGSGAVGKALDVQDQTKARAEALDSLLR